MTGQKYNGIILINKEISMTSHDVVARLRRILGMKRIGHTGTLDPDVSGLMIICLGKATRIAEYLLEADKSYEGVIKLGEKTSSQDASGEIVKRSSYIPDLNEIEEVSKKFLGPIKQIPPMYSAVRHKGKRLHELAREGKTVERKEREAYIYQLDFFKYSYPFISFKCTCSKGTYVRTLMNDIGDELGCLAHLYSMQRTSTGKFSLDESYSLDEIEDLKQKGDLSFIKGLEDGLFMFDRLDIDGKYFDKLINGSKIEVDLDSSDKIYKVYCRDEFIGLSKISKIDGKNKLVFEKMLYNNER